MPRSSKTICGASFIDLAKVKWISLFNTLRNNWAHEGTKEKGLNKSDVELLQKIHDQLGLGSS